MSNSSNSLFHLLLYIASGHSDQHYPADVLQKGRVKSWLRQVSNGFLHLAEVLPLTPKTALTNKLTSHVTDVWPPKAD